MSSRISGCHQNSWDLRRVRTINADDRCPAFCSLPGLHLIRQVASPNPSLLASPTAASVQGTVATGPRAGQWIRRRLVDSKEGCVHAEQPSAPQPVCRLSWARLLARVFSVDVTECPACGGKMKIIAALTDPLAIRTYLDGVGLASRPPPIAPARPRPQAEFEYTG